MINKSGKKGSNGGSNRVLIIGLDAATLDLINPWITEGKLHVMKKLMDGGAYGELTSVDPPLTPPAWTSAMTGKNPGKHGIYEFTKRIAGSYDFRPIYLKDRKSRVLWDILSNVNKRVIIVNDPITYPVRKIRGIHIAGNMAPSLDSDAVYPPELKEEVLDKFGYRFKLDVEFKEGKEDAFFDDVLKMSESQFNVSLYLMKKYDWDFFFHVFMGADMIPHKFWKFMDSTHPDHDPEKAKPYEDAILRVYQYADGMVGKMIENVDENTTVIIMSDHGMGPLYKSVNFNDWLLDVGMLSLKRNFSTKVKEWMARHGASVKGVYGFMLKFGLTKFISRRSMETKIKGAKFFLGFSDIEWSKTKAYSVGNMSQIYINLKGREPGGIVQPGREYEDVRKKIIEELYRMKDPLTNEKIVDRVIKKEEVYFGEHVDQAPDLFVIMRGMTYFGVASPEKGAFSGQGIIHEPIKDLSAEHRYNGVFIVQGPSTKKGTLVQDAHITDIAPTVLYIMGLPIPSDMDGKVLTDAFKQSHLESTPVKYLDTATGKIYQKPAVKEKGMRGELKKELDFTQP